MTPIATKSLGAHGVTGLNMELRVWSININAKVEWIEVSYEVVQLSPNGSVVCIESTGMYSRFNSDAIPGIADVLDEEGNVSIPGKAEIPAKPRFTEYRESQVGLAIAAMVQQTVNNYPNLTQ